MAKLNALFYLAIKGTFYRNIPCMQLYFINSESTWISIMKPLFYYRVALAQYSLCDFWGGWRNWTQNAIRQPFGICILYHFRKNKKCEHKNTKSLTVWNSQFLAIWLQWDGQANFQSLGWVQVSFFEFDWFKVGLGTKKLNPSISETTEKILRYLGSW